MINAISVKQAVNIIITYCKHTGVCDKCVIKSFCDESDNLPFSGCTRYPLLSDDTITAADLAPNLAAAVMNRKD